MATMSIPEVAVTTEELDRDPERILRLAEQTRVTIYSGETPVACLVPANEWRDLVRAIDSPNGCADLSLPDGRGKHS
jgi:hypothetical protein